jgi:endonuclease/exonuclease/phosphatase family metal-dependent hydrolase
MRLASFNLLHGLAVSDGRVDPQRICAAVAALDVDVLALQEVDRDQPRSAQLDLTALAAEALGARPADSRFAPTLIGTPGFEWRATRDDDAPGTAAYGIGLVSRVPVERWSTIRLGASPVRLPVRIETPRPRYLFVRDEPRVALAAVLAPGHPVRTVVSTHLSFAPGWNLAQLRRLTRALRPFPRPLVLLGDLNLPARVTALLPGWTMLARTPTYPAEEPRVQLDHALLATDRGAARRDSGTAPVPTVSGIDAVRASISDHRALVVDLARPVD